MVRMLIQYFCLGFVVTAIPGAVFFETIRRTLTEKNSIMKFMAGNFSGMFLIIFSVLFGLSTLLSDKSLNRAFYVLSGAVLLYIGVISLLKKYDKPTISVKNMDKSSLTAYLTGFVLAAANPISIVFWISMTGKMVQDNISFGAVLLSCISIVLGASVVFILLIALASRSKDNIKTHHLLLLSRGFGLILAFTNCRRAHKIYLGVTPPKG